MLNLPQIQNPAPQYHWTGTNQRCFLETLADTGVVSVAAKAVSMSSEAAYQLRRNGEGKSFALGWAAALLVARDRIVDDLMERALMGQQDVYIRDPENNRMVRDRKDNRLGMGLLARLDRMVGDAARFGGHAEMARIVAGDFDRFMDLVEAQAGGAETGLFLATHADGADSAFHNQLAQNSADFEDMKDEEIEEPSLPSTPESAAEQLSVWWDDYAEEWRTDFPPPDDFEGDEIGHYGDDGYERTLNGKEAAIQDARRKLEDRPFLAAAHAARSAFFAADGEVNAEVERLAQEEEENDEFAKIMREVDRAVARNCEAATDVENPQSDRVEHKALEVVMATVDEGDVEAESPPHKTSVDNGVVTHRTITMKPQAHYGMGGRIPPWAQRVW